LNIPSDLSLPSTRFTRACPHLPLGVFPRHTIFLQHLHVEAFPRRSLLTRLGVCLVLYFVARRFHSHSLQHECFLLPYQGGGRLLIEEKGDHKIYEGICMLARWHVAKGCADGACGLAVNDTAVITTHLALRKEAIHILTWQTQIVVGSTRVTEGASAQRKTV
jgi:hypothetical protein